MSAENTKTTWLIAGILVLIIVISGALISYNILSRIEYTGPSLEGFEAYFDTRSKLLPNLSLVTVGPEKARYEVYIFYDLYCPYCAWELYESLPMLLEHTKRENIKLYLVDMILHPGAIESHGLLRSSVGVDGAFLEALYKASYEFHVNRAPPEPSLMRKILEDLGVNVDEARVREESGKAREITIKAVKLLAPLGPVGTPTIVIYDTEFESVRVIPGRVEPEELNVIIRGLP